MVRKKQEDEGQSINDIFGAPEEPKIKIDPETGLVEQVFDDDNEIDVNKQLWEKNPRRSQALADLWYDELQKSLEEGDEPEEAKKRLAFLMTTNNVIDIIMGALPEELALEVSYSLDHTIAMALVNKKFDVDLMEEEKKAISIVKREDYDTDDDFMRALEALEDHWWSLGQPKLDMRNPNDAIIEMLRKYKLNE